MDDEIEKICREIGIEATQHIDSPWWEIAQECAINAAITAFHRALERCGADK